MKTSNLYSIDLKDLAKGLIVAVGSAMVVATIHQLTIWFFSF